MYGVRNLQISKLSAACSSLFTHLLVLWFAELPVGVANQIQNSKHSVLLI